jgi:hypothetical protein
LFLASIYEEYIDVLAILVKPKSMTEIYLCILRIHTVVQYVTVYGLWSSLSLQDPYLKQRRLLCSVTTKSTKQMIRIKSSAAPELVAESDFVIEVLDCQYTFRDQFE